MMKKCFAVLLVLFISLLPFQVFADDMEQFGYGFLDRDGKVVIPCQYDYAYNFSMGRSVVFSGQLNSYGSPDKGKFGVIDANGSMIIPLSYDDASPYDSCGISRVSKGDKYGLIDIDGNIILDFIYDDISSALGPDGLYDGLYEAFNGTKFYGLPMEGTYYALDSTGNVLFEGVFDNFNATPYYYTGERNDKWALFNLEGERITGFDYDYIGSYSEGYIQFRKDDLYGYMDLDGNIMIEATFDRAGRFSDGQAIVRRSGKYCLIDQSGSIIREYDPDYVFISPVDGVTYAFEGSLNSYGSPDYGTYYLMSLDGTYLTRGYSKNKEDSDSMPFLSDGVWTVSENDTYYAISLSGVELFSAQCDRLYACGDDRYVLKHNDKYALADADGNLLTDYIWDEYHDFSEGLMAVQRKAITNDFRNTRWGMTENEVRSVEGSNPDYTGKLDGRNAWYIGYDTSLMGNDALVAFYFGPEGLYQARYIWNEKHSNERLYIDDYQSVREQLTNKYGDPLIDWENWDTDQHKKRYSDDKGTALLYGYLSYLTYYSTSSSYIEMNMSADNFDISFVIDYTSKEIDAPAIDYSNVF